MRILVLGYIIRGPLGGLAWHHLQYVLGLKQLGHEVLFVEDSEDYPACYDPQTSLVTEDPAYGLRFINDLFNYYNLQSQWAYYDAHTNRWYGRDKQYVFDFSSSADIVLNISGVNPLRDWWVNIPSRVFIDTDPGFTQIKILTDTAYKALANAHTVFFSFAENIGQQYCSVPLADLTWIPTRQPIYIPAWKICEPSPLEKWTTVMQWDSYQAKEYDGRFYGMKSLSFKDYMTLPGRFTNEVFEIALGGVSAPREELKKNGWDLISSLVPTKTAQSYQEYIQSSKGEWSIAKHGYVLSNSGWFSERSACYLASGKPVLVQDTGFSKVLPTGKGLLIFTSMEEAEEAIRIINEQYALHCRSAREMAEDHFDASRVLTHILDRVT
ncbi:hypothetical protein LK994_04260 [Ferruginibacter lapsinanis]|uniref:hypothetical protein n=1 Tax=Ferruginibacter lapsinanis TaxID=563172 RepID=UPI001E2B095F|nr:hypothetical protein [Ferruginibacter lapsinanis]UEG50685.1 hypothetical protein LK994_04260 [Ferruginibacter lapsinanis]